MKNFSRPLGAQGGTMKYKIILCTALLLAAGFSAPAHGPYDCWGYSGKKGPRIYCAIPGPHGERPGGDTYSRSVVLVSVEKKMARSDMEKICRKYDLSILYEYKNFSIYALQTNGDRRDREMNELTAALEKEKGILSAERDRMLRLIE